MNICCADATLTTSASAAVAIVRKLRGEIVVDIVCLRSVEDRRHDANRGAPDLAIGAVPRLFVAIQPFDADRQPPAELPDDVGARVIPRRAPIVQTSSDRVRPGSAVLGLPDRPLPQVG